MINYISVKEKLRMFHTISFKMSGGREEFILFKNKKKVATVSSYNGNFFPRQNPKINVILPYLRKLKKITLKLN